MVEEKKIRMQCPECRVKVRGNESLLAKKVTCPKCKNKIRFIRPIGAAQKSTGDTGDYAPVQSTRRTSGRRASARVSPRKQPAASREWLRIPLIVGGIAVLLIVGFFILRGQIISANRQAWEEENRSKILELCRAVQENTTAGNAENAAHYYKKLRSALGNKTLVSKDLIDSTANAERSYKKSLVHAEAERVRVKEEIAQAARRKEEEAIEAKRKKEEMAAAAQRKKEKDALANVTKEKEKNREFSDKVKKSLLRYSFAQAEIKRLRREGDAAERGMRIYDGVGAPKAVIDAYYKGIGQRVQDKLSNISKSREAYDEFEILCKKSKKHFVLALQAMADVCDDNSLSAPVRIEAKIFTKMIFDVVKDAQLKKKLAE